MTVSRNLPKRKSISPRLLALAAFLLMLCPESVWTAPITSQQAETAVKAWLATDARPLGAGLGGKISGRTESYEADDGQLCYFVVYLEPAGFVILPADDLAEPIVCFTATGRYDPSDGSPLSSLVTKDLAIRLRQAHQSEASAREGQGLPAHAVRARGRWARFQLNAEQLLAPPTSVSDVRVAPLIQSRWSQSTECGSNCYNYYTPNHYVCGCVATAQAQLMRFWQYPTGSVGTPCYSITVCGTPRTGCLRGGDGYGGPYAWADMVLDPDCSTTEAQRETIGALCSDVGVSVNMNYCSGGSGAYLDNAKSLKNTFGYSNAVEGNNRGANIGVGLNGMINPNLDAGFPVLLGIVGTSGHAIVADGYGYHTAVLYHHLNMGWAGSSDAWYNLPDVASYTIVTGCVYNIYVSGSGEIISGRVVNASGAPIIGAAVRAERTGGGVYTTTTNDGGIYALAKIPSASTYLISVSAVGYTFASRGATTGTSTGDQAVSGNVWGIDFTADPLPCPPPDVTTGVSASDGTYCDKVRVCWTAVSGADSYKVYRSTTNIACPGTELGMTTGTCFDDTSANPGTSYYYTVRAGNACGDGPCSNTDSGHRKAGLPAPGGVTASDGTHCNKVAVTWNTVSGAVQYKVYRSTGNVGGVDPPLAIVGNTSYDDTSCLDGVTYYYSIRAVSSCGDGSCSLTDSGYRKTVTAAPGGVSATDGTYCNKVRVCWTAVPGAGSYKVFRSATPLAQCPGTAIATVTATCYEDTSADPGTTFYYSVKVTSACGDGGCSDADSGYRAAPQALSRNIARALSAEGIAVVCAPDVDAGSTPGSACTLTSREVARGNVSCTASSFGSCAVFSCADIGTQTVTLRVTQSDGQKACSTATVTVQNGDSDSDGISNCLDGCPSDPAKTAPGICGCGAADIDSDSDGLEDCLDACPGDSAKTAPGACGCGAAETDSDGDGLPDCVDECPGEPDVDSDHDGAVDCLDGCLADPLKTAPGVCGCGITDADRDSDGLADCLDRCPDDQNKTSPGLCGCGEADADSDSDSVPDCFDVCPGAPDVDSDSDGAIDCLDGCPVDPAKTTPQVCGCGVAESDTDSDGSFDCVDGCPVDGLKTVPGSCGCNVPDTDSDSDGVADCLDRCQGSPDIDSDSDGVLDCLEGCPSDRRKKEPGICGCGVGDGDKDSDGVADCLDGCPSDKRKTSPGICGCGMLDTDSDADGVPNCLDRCAGTPDVDPDSDGALDCIDGCPADPAKTSPGTCGCGQAETDTDSDGFRDCIDGCPSDAAKQLPGVCGCGAVDVDSDSDGSADCVDGCPQDAAKKSPGACGCGRSETDTDRDGAPDCVDGCPMHRAKTAPGACGCGSAETDSDQDGTPDCVDACPGNPAKTALGVCGCGMSDADTDSDGALDCRDLCPQDAAKTAPGACGCGAADADSDADGTLDCNDGCPSDPGKVGAGACGCGRLETDADADGTPDCVDNCPALANPGQDDADADGIGDACEIPAGGHQLPDYLMPGAQGPDDQTPDDQAPSQQVVPGTAGCGAAGTQALLACASLLGCWAVGRRSHSLRQQL